MHEIIVHPLVLLNIVDHHNRYDGQRVVGIILGTTDETIHVTNSFAVPFEEDDTNWFLDTSYLLEVYGLCKRISHNEKILGWYHSGATLTPKDAEITKSLVHLINNPYVLIVDLFTGEIPIKVYQLKRNEELVGIPSLIEAEEAEEVGVEHLIRDIKDDEKDNLEIVRYSLRSYRKNLNGIIKYIEDVMKGNKEYNYEIFNEIQECYNEIPVIKNEEALGGVYVNSLVKCVVKWKDLVENRKESEMLGKLELKIG